MNMNLLAVVTPPSIYNIGYNKGKNMWLPSFFLTIYERVDNLVTC